MLNLTPFQSRLARAALNWTFTDVEARTGIDRCRVNRFEIGKRIDHGDVVTAKLRQIFEEAGLVFREDGISYPRQWTYD
jgi:transcriptional regulator with XRE-family HTH domain